VKRDEIETLIGLFDRGIEERVADRDRLMDVLVSHRAQTGRMPWDSVVEVTLKTSVGGVIVAVPNPISVSTAFLFCQMADDKRTSGFDTLKSGLRQFAMTGIPDRLFPFNEAEEVIAIVGDES
jgi:hypothetical protein